ncbi:MAG: plastocyanin/azurin family copper-binding protein [Thaumarchaeota archaeon]|nr:plastocyanin/azurin family copper-binding protein [Nitrososphaerota archaeon]
MQTKTVLVIVLAIVVSIGLSVPIVSAYVGGSGNFLGQMSSRGNAGQSGYNGYGGMMGGYTGSGYGGGMMGGGYGGGMMGGYGSANYGGMMSGSYSGMMGGYNGAGGMMATLGESVSIQQATQSVSSPPSYAQINKGNDTIAFHSQSINILALAIMPEGAVNLTGTRPPSYSTDDVFVIYGLINPTLVIPKGATVQFTIVNLDNDMYHNLVVSSISPPYLYMAMQVMMYANASGSSGYYPFMSMMGFLPPADYNQGSAHEYSYALTLNQSGSFWYLCTYPGHAQSGMYGQILVNA